MWSQFYTDDVIDLTNTQTFDRDNPPIVFSNSIICIDSDDSFSSSPVPERTLRRPGKEQKIDSKNNQKAVIHQPGKNQPKESKISFGECPICWDQLGTRPLASTICGHVFCIQCIKTSLCTEKRCPMCRTVLKGKLAYHPLYLPR